MVPGGTVTHEQIHAELAAVRAEVADQKDRIKAIDARLAERMTRDEAAGNAMFDEVKTLVAGVHEALGDLSVKVDRANEIVEAVSTAKSVTKAVKWVAGLIVVIGGAVAAVKAAVAVTIRG